MDKSSHFLFFADDLSSATITLDEAESRHAVSALRILPGQILRVTDGNGSIVTGPCHSGADRRLTVTVSSRSTLPRTAPQLHLCIGLPERDAFETILTNTTALGIARIIPVTAEYCQKTWWTNWEKAVVRFRQKMIASLKQSHNVYLPELLPPCSLTDAIQHPGSITMLVAEMSGTTLHGITFPTDTPISCFIGPPGGFSAEELRLLTERSALPVRIAPTRLRTELAATVLCGQIIGIYR
ncbi:MAG: 16S rRNA (uracil(1498)-N(3))-methyltransferase [Chitinispirillaceae bacterium]|nr:16S rRNA (uracil(1498)-N(3))-methyltransferase [Chitinispirillaceae bacterium]